MFSFSSHVLRSFSDSVCLALLDPRSDRQGPSAVWKQHQTGGEGSRVRRDAQDPDQKGQQPFLWRGVFFSQISVGMKLFPLKVLRWAQFSLFNLLNDSVWTFFCRCFSTTFACFHRTCLKITSAFGSVPSFEVLSSVSSCKHVNILCRCIIPLHWGLTASWENSRYSSSVFSVIYECVCVCVCFNGSACALSHSWTLVMFMMNQVRSETTDLCLIYICSELFIFDWTWCVLPRHGLTNVHKHLSV